MKVLSISFLSALLVTVVFFSSCGSKSGSENNSQSGNAESEENRVRGKITVAALPENFALANQLASGYVAYNKNVIIDVKTIDVSNIDEAIKGGKFHLFFLNGLKNPYPEMESQLIARDVFVLCVNFNNPALQKLVIRGLMPSKIKSIFSSPALLKWSDVVKTDDKSPVKPYLGASNSTSNTIVSTFLGIQQSTTVTYAVNEQDLYSNIANNTGGIGFLSSVLAYDKQTTFRANGIYILPTDFNENKIADDNELIYDDFKILEKAVSKGGYPSQLIRNHYFVWASDVPEKEIVDDFLSWVSKNYLTYIEHAGFFAPGNTNAKAEQE